MSVSKPSRIDELIAELCPDGVAYAPVADVAVVGTGSSDRKDATPDGPYPFYVRSKDVLKSPTYEYDEDAVLIPGEGGVGEIFHCVSGKYALHQRAYRIAPHDPSVFVPFLYHYLRSNFRKFILAKAVNATVTSIRKPMITSFRVPIPPLEVQREIVRVLDTFSALEAELEAELEARRRQYEHYRDSLLSLGRNEVEWTIIPALADNLDSLRRPITKAARRPGGVPYYGASGVVDLVDGHLFEEELLLVSEDGANLLARSTPIAFGIAGKAWVNNHAHVLRFASRVEQRFVEIYLNSIDLGPYVSGGAQPKLNQRNLNLIPIPRPSLAEQERIVEILDHFDALVNDLSIGLPAELAARRKQYEYYRDKLLTFKELPA